MRDVEKLKSILQIKRAKIQSQDVQMAMLNRKLQEKRFDQEKQIADLDVLEREKADYVNVSAQSAEALQMRHTFLNSYVYGHKQLSRSIQIQTKKVNRIQDVLKSINMERANHSKILIRERERIKQIEKIIKTHDEKNFINDDE